MCMCYVAAHEWITYGVMFVMVDVLSHIVLYICIYICVCVSESENFVDKFMWCSLLFFIVN